MEESGGKGVYPLFRLGGEVVVVRQVGDQDTAGDDIVVVDSVAGAAKQKDTGEGCRQAEETLALMADLFDGRIHCLFIGTENSLRKINIVGQGCMRRCLAMKWLRDELKILQFHGECVIIHHKVTLSYTEWTLSINDSYLWIL
ncbi:hypothetical protein O1400_14595 [Bacteroides fragilis]|uniref:hypothetical protein n=1 Tax=Bacteroides fragilis TaxID=817 RepID=UPI0022AAB28C|nr:hypothetical protein [Bacteroides fragilis]MCZ2603567.1 hypothetical protein [Bacteroides fragilis]